MIAPDLIPERLRESLDRYGEHGIPTGDCLRAVLAGDLFGAFERADPETAACMMFVVSYVTTRLPSSCWGSYQVVERWIILRRRQHATEREMSRHG